MLRKLRRASKLRANKLHVVESRTDRTVHCLDDLLIL